MSNVNNKQKVKKYPNTEKRRTKHLYEEFGPDSNFDIKHYKKEEKYSNKDKPESEHTAWN